MAVCQQMVGASNAAWHHHVEIAVQAGHRRFWIEKKGKIVDGYQLAPGAAGGQDKVGGVEEVDRSSGEPLDTWPRAIEPMPKAHHVAFTDRRAVERQRRLAAFFCADGPDHKEAQIITWI